VLGDVWAAVQEARGRYIILANATSIPWSWNIDIFIAIFPVTSLCTYSLVSIALNPGLMTFYW
jgi:hypothetical protein